MTHYSPKTIDKARPPWLVPIEQGYYLLKLYAYNHDALFGEVTGEHFQLNSLGKIAADEWVRSADTYPGLELDEWLVLSNRIEGIVSIRDLEPDNGYGFWGSKPRLLSAFIASYKAAAAKRINLHRNAPGNVVWQRSYQERFIPDKAALERIRQMLQNPPSTSLQ